MRLRRIQASIIAIFVLFAFTVTGIGLHFLEQERLATLSRAEAATRDLARVMEEFARRAFESAELSAELVARRVAEAGGTAAIRGSDALFLEFRSLSARTTGDHIMVVDSEARPVLTTAQNPPPPTLEFRDRDWFRRHEAGIERHVGGALVSRVTGEILFTYTRRLTRPDGRLDGVVQIAMHPTMFENPALGSDLGAGVRLGMFDMEGRVLGLTGLTAERAEKGIGGRPEFLSFIASASGTMRDILTPDGEERILSWRQVTGWPVLVTASLPVSSALAPWRETQRLTAMTLLAVLAGLSGLTIIALRQARHQDVAQAGLSAANAALREATFGLEARVAERTRALAESEARFREIFNSSFQFMGLLSPDGTLLEMNDTALEFGGVTRAEVVGRPFWEARWWDMGEETQERLRAAIAAAAAGEPQRYEVVVRGAGDRLASIDFSLRPIHDESGRIILLVPEGHDLTDLKAAEARLRASQKMEVLGQLTGGVAHDFNNLLMAVLGNLALLRKRVPDDPRITRLLDGATQGAERGAALTQRLLAFARRQELRPSAVDLAALVRGMTALLERSVGPAVRIEMELPEGLPLARVDANQLELALLNLAVNSRDAMPKGGALGISIGRARAPGPEAPSGLAPGAYLRLQVRDEGTGMDTPTLQRATEPFFTTKGAGQGSGLGLAMVQGLAQQSGGGLRLTSRPGEGTVAEIWLPVSREKGRPKPAATSEAALPPSPPRRVLVVDDDPLVVAGTAAMLEDLGHQTVTAHSGQEALALLGRDGAVEVVLTDHAMPGMTGFELVRHLRARRPDLSVILATGFTELPEGLPDDLPRLNKPYRQADLALALAQLKPPEE